MQQLVLPCLILAEMLNEVALDCSVYIGNSDAVSTVKASYQSRIDVIFSGSQKNAGDFPHLSYNMKLSNNSCYILLLYIILIFYYNNQLF